MGWSNIYSFFVVHSYSWLHFNTLSTAKNKYQHSTATTRHFISSLKDKSKDEEQNEVNLLKWLELEKKRNCEKPIIRISLLILENRKPYNQWLKLEFSTWWTQFSNILWQGQKGVLCARGKKVFLKRKKLQKILIFARLSPLPLTRRN